ncbi:unnamed protein product [Schistosoma turkestanicum]|nr:unnamed protein product [Schistosoma turkestanicum]
MLINKAIFIWTTCSTFLLLLVLKLDEIISWNWFIIFIPIWLLDLILFTTTILYMSQKFTHILGQYNLNSRFSQTLLLSFILWKFIAQIILCLSLEGYLQTLLDTFSRLDQASDNNQSSNSTVVKSRMIYAVLPIWTTMLVCLLIVCAQIVNPRLPTV